MDEPKPDKQQAEAQASAPGSADAQADPLDPTRTRYLTPDTCHIHLGTHQALHVSILNERIYGGVFAAYAFPVLYPTGYISLFHSGGEGQEREIGIIRDLAEFSEAEAALVRQALERRYFIHTIRKITHIGWKYGFVAMDVETDKGNASFLMRHEHNQVVDYGLRGKVLIDVNLNRYLIPDLEKLSPREHRDFTRIIYW